VLEVVVSRHDRFLPNRPMAIMVVLLMIRILVILLVMIRMMILWAEAMVSTTRNGWNGSPP
jgi:hypothetical protein